MDPKTLAPEGTVLNAKKVEDARAVVRVPFTQIVPLALQVVDTENTGSSGQGWKIGEPPEQETSLEWQLQQPWELRCFTLPCLAVALWRTSSRLLHHTWMVQTAAACISASP